MCKEAGLRVPGGINERGGKGGVVVGLDGVDTLL